jgi:large subunit ribosomal protein L18
MISGKIIREKRIRRHRRVRARIKGTAERPRLSVFRSNKHLTVQLIDDTVGRTIAAVSDRDIAAKSRASRMSAAVALGALIAEKAAAHKVGAAVFDRGGWQYHGAVRAVAEAARKAGLVI